MGALIAAFVTALGLGVFVAVLIGAAVARRGGSNGLVQPPPVATP
jgi:hypothetical protein